MSKLRAELTALKTRAGNGDPARLRYIESLLQRAETRGGRLGEMLQERASAAMAQYQAQLARPTAKPARPPNNQPLRELNRLFDALREEQDDPHIAPLEAALRQQELDLVDAISDKSPAPAARRLPQDSQQELKAARKFHAAMVRLNADKVVNGALAEVPAEAGPLNPQRLATRSLTAMRDLSPHYLSRFVSYIDTLFWLEQADKPGKR